jgi:hypothetical protein
MSSSLPSAHLFYIAIYHKLAEAKQSDDQRSVKLAESSNFSAFNFFARSTAGNTIKFACRTVINRINAGVRASINSGEEKLPFVVHGPHQVTASTNPFKSTLIIDSNKNCYLCMYM